MTKTLLIIIITIFTVTAAPATAGGAMDSIIQQKRAQADVAKARSANKIEYLRNNKESSNIISTAPSYNLETLETASGSKIGRTAEEAGINETNSASGNVAVAVKPTGTDPKDPE